MADFPTLNAGDLNKTPVSIAAGSYGATFDNPYYRAAVDDMEKFIIYGGDPKYAFNNPQFDTPGQYSAAFIRNLIGYSRSKFTDFNVTINSDPTKLNISSGTFYTQLGKEYNVPSQTISISNIGVVYVLALDNSRGVEFILSTKLEATDGLTIAVVIVDDTYRATKVMNYADDINSPFSLFADYINQLGPWWLDLSIVLNPAGTGFSTRGGDVDTYSAGTYRVIPAQTAIPFIRISTSLAFEYNISTFTIADFKKQGTGSISGNSTAVIWLVFAGMSGNFYMLAPFTRISLTANGAVSGADILDYYEANIKFKEVESFLAPVAAIVCYGNSNALGDLQIVAIANRLSHGKIVIAETESYPIPPVDKVAADPILVAQLGVENGQYALLTGMGSAPKLGSGQVVMKANARNTAPIWVTLDGQKATSDGRKCYVIRLPNVLKYTGLTKARAVTDIPGITGITPDDHVLDRVAIDRVSATAKALGSITVIPILRSRALLLLVARIATALSIPESEVFSIPTQSAKYLYFCSAKYIWKDPYPAEFGSDIRTYNLDPALNYLKSSIPAINIGHWFSPIFGFGNGEYSLSPAYSATMFSDFAGCVKTINSVFGLDHPFSSAFCGGVARKGAFDKLPANTNTLNPATIFELTSIQKEQCECMEIIIVPNLLH